MVWKSNSRMNYANTLKTNKEDKTAELEKNFNDIRSFLESICDQVSVVTTYIITARTDGYGIIHLQYNLHTIKWDMCYNDHMKIKNINHDDLLSDFFVGSKFVKYFTELKTMNDVYLQETFDSISMKQSIVVKKRSDNCLSVRYKNQYDFDITVNCETTNFDIEFTNLNFFSKNVKLNKTTNITKILDSLVNSWYQYEYGH